MAIADITKPMALDETLQATNTALGAIAKDETLQATNTALGDIEDDIEAIGTALGTLNTTTGGVAKDVTLGLVNTALGTINTALGQIKNAIDAMAVSNIGNMSALTTTDKSSLVGAVNEVNSGKVSKSGDTMTGNFTLSNASGEIALRGAGSRYTHIKSSATGADHTNYFPNKDGTLATTDDISNAISSIDRELVYAQKDKNITITFSGSAITRVLAGFLIVSGQIGIIEPISFMFSGMGNYPTRESIDNMTVYLSANDYNITGGVQCINIPAHIGSNWGYIMIKEIGDALKDITITVTYS